ncbi:MAG: VapC toxin family PIN domain ribonuclease, partial [Planctomycetaceae bacterium]
LGALEALEVEIVGEPLHRSLGGLAMAARPHQLMSAYDAVYLDFAISLALPLFTDDGNLRVAAERMGVVVIEPAAE